MNWLVIMAMYVPRETESPFLDGVRDWRYGSVEYTVGSVSLIVYVKDSVEESCVSTVNFLV